MKVLLSILLGCRAAVDEAGTPARSFILLLVSAMSMRAQSIALSVSPASVAAGAGATLTLAYTDANPTANVAGVQWMLTLPAGVTAGTPVLGAASTAAAKAITCGASICIDIGNGATLNDTGMASGVLATIPLTVAAGTASGVLSVSLSGVGGATGPGLAASIATTPATITVLSKYDLNGDGVVNVADVGIMLSQAEGTTACTAPSTGVGDGKCGLADVELEILAALGVIH